MKVYNCECGCIIGINQIKRHKNGKKHHEKMIKMKLQYFPTDEDELKNKWCDIIERRNYYWKHEEYENNTIEKINQFKELSNNRILLYVYCFKNKKLKDKWFDIINNWKLDKIKMRREIIRKEKTALRYIQLQNLKCKYLEWLIDNH